MTKLDRLKKKKAHLTAKLDEIEKQIKILEHNKKSTNNYPFLEYGTKVTCPSDYGTRVCAVCVTEGNRVKKNDRLFVIEKFKMETEICAPCDGIVEKIFTYEGDEVACNEVLALIV